MKILLPLLLLSLSITTVSSQSSFSLGSDLMEKFRMGSGTYGNACGIASQDPEMRIQAEAMIEANDISGLIGWLEGSNVHKAYGAEGIIRLNNKGVTIQAEVKSIVLDIKNSDELLSACRGCIYDNITLYQALESFDFK